MDILSLHGIKITSLLGLYNWERQHPQTLLLNLDIALPNSLASVSDDVADTIDYAELTDSLRQHTAVLQKNLIEALAEEIAHFVMSQYGIPWVKIRLTKPGILADVKEVAIQIERGDFP